jgi:glycosyltransferase involved in cell wall biosynthesis
MNDGPIERSSSPRPKAPLPKVSVAMVAYQHEKFIEQAVESVMTQKASFPYELVIGEDCSTDRTREIVLRLQKKYPNCIRLLLPEKNLGMMANFIQTLGACEGQYIALLEGDDYWTETNKLQKQVDLLEAHPEYAGCFALTRVVADNHPTECSYIPARHTSTIAFTTEGLLQKNSIATASVMYRNVMRKINFAPLQLLKMIDWPLHVLVSLEGPIGYIPQEMACYRQHGGGIWTGRDETARLAETVKFYSVLRQIMSSKYTRQISERIVKTHQLIALEWLKRGDRRQARNRVFQSFAAIPPASLFSFGWFIKRSILLFLGVYGMPLARVEAGLRR